MEGVPSIEVAELEQRLAVTEDLLLVHFFSPLASGCHLLHTVLETVEPRFRELVEIVEVEVPLLELESVRSFRIREVPTLVVFNTQREVERLECIVSPEELSEFLEWTISFYGPISGKNAP